MKALVIEATRCTPKINFDDTKNVLEIRGESYPENTALFYQPIFAWLADYLENLNEEMVEVNVEMIYFNSSSSKVLMDFFDVLEYATSTGKKIQVNWCYDKDNDMALEYGEEFKEDLDTLNFSLKSI
jgi:hypothetical protein